MRVVRSGVLVVAVALIASLSGCGGAGGGDPRGCTGEGDCGALARCLGANCVEDAAPVAVLLVPEAPEALALVEFDASASSDPDAPLGDEVVAFHWTFTSLDDACAAPTVTGTEAMARVRFGCDGAFRVELVVVDEKGKESSPASADFSVAPHSGSPTLIPSADQTLNHLCSGTPRVCTTEGTAPVVSVQLAAGIEPVGAVVYHWTVDAPQSGPLDAHKRVAFTPSAAVSNPSVHIEVDEIAAAALVDDWILRVTACDGAGPLGEATTRISVKNRQPALAAAASSVSVDHTYSGGSYRASAAASRWQDPDGDPLSQATGSTGSGICASVSFQPDGTAIIQCARPFGGTPALSGFVATHDVAVRARDPWEPAAAASSTAVTIRNRAVVASNSSAAAVAPAGTCDEGGCCSWTQEPPLPKECVAYNVSCDAYTAHPRPSILDPDGDPVAVTWTGSGWGPGTPVCEPSACAADLAIPATSSCGGNSTGSLVGNFTATDGLTTGSGTLTVAY